MTTTSPQQAAPRDAAVLERLSALNRFLPVWIGAAMLVGLGLGRLFPGLNNTLDRVRIGTVSLPIAIGLLLMMYPVLAKVRYDDLGHVTGDRRMLGTSLMLNWLVGPLLMFTLAWMFLPDLPEYRTGLIIVGLARCIAMVLIWNDLACGDREAAAVLVALNSLFQIAAYSLLGYFYLQVLPGWLGLEQASIHFSVGAVARAVAVFLGVPLVAGYLTRRVGEARRGRDWYETRFLPRIGPIALWGLLFTVVVLFALQGDKITNNPLDVARIAVPLLAYFALMWTGAFALGAAAAVRLSRVRRASPSPPRATTSSSPSRWPSACSASPPARPSPASSVPSSRCPRSSRSSTSRCGPAVASSRRGGHLVNCYDCATEDHLNRAAVAVCHDCGAAVCDAARRGPRPSPDPHRRDPAPGGSRTGRPSRAVHHL